MKHYLLTNFVYLLEGKNKHQKQVYRNSVVATAKILTVEIFLFCFTEDFHFDDRVLPLPCNEHDVFHFLGRLEQGYGTRQRPRSSTASRKSA